VGVNEQTWTCNAMHRTVVTPDKNTKKKCLVTPKINMLALISFIS